MTVVVEKLLQFFSVTCRHRRISQPFTAAATRSANGWDEIGSGPGHYVVCLECGKKFTYDWEQMRIVR